MPKPKKIHKKKSFMFTTKHQSVNGLISLVIGIISVLALICCVVISYRNRGDLLLRYGGVGLFATIGNFVGIVASLISLNERDIFVWVPRTGLIINLVMVIIWALLLISGIGAF